MTDTPQTESQAGETSEARSLSPMAAKKVVSLSKRKKPQTSQSETTEPFLDRGHEICTHLTTWGTGEVKDVSALYEITTLLVKQIEALFSAISAIGGGSGDEEILSLCMVGEDLAREAYRRVDRLYDEV
jgi:hypothetical protein